MLRSAQIAHVCMQDSWFSLLQRGCCVSEILSNCLRRMLALWDCTVQVQHEWKYLPDDDDDVGGVFGKVVYVVRGWLYVATITCCDVELIFRRAELKKRVEESERVCLVRFVYTVRSRQFDDPSAEIKIKYGDAECGRVLWRSRLDLCVMWTCNWACFWCADHVDNRRYSRNSLE